MRYWRMMMRYGEGGPDIFPDCKQRGIAALDFYWGEGQRKRVVEDCTKLSDDDYLKNWRSRALHKSGRRNSLWILWKEMKIDDVIYVKTGPWIVGKGSIIGEYEFDPDILKGTMGSKWGQFVRVEWINDFIKFKFKFRAQRFIIREIIEPELQRFLDAERASGAKLNTQ
ncbi:MAG: hypothetical protein MUQ00_02400 [Candidatus Aminicenantes bacterium]|nr:hypothetical protein [Candidatus Aminicenantes bacterium]